MGLAELRDSDLSSSRMSSYSGLATMPAGSRPATFMYTRAWKPPSLQATVRSQSTSSGDSGVGSEARLEREVSATPEPLVHVEAAVHALGAVVGDDEDGGVVVDESKEPPEPLVAVGSSRARRWRHRAAGSGRFPSRP